MVSIRIAVCCVLLFHCALSEAKTKKTVETSTTSIHHELINATTESHHEVKNATTESHHEPDNTTGTPSVSSSTESEIHNGTTVQSVNSTTEHSVQNSTEGVTGNETTNSTESGTHVNATTATPTTKSPIYPSGDPKNCQNFKDFMTTLPGQGWDNLVYATKRNVFSYNYSLCRTTYDNKYLIPNNVYVMMEFPSSDPTLKTKIFIDYKKYTPIISENTKLPYDVKAFHDVVGSFSKNFQNVKTKMYKDNGVAVRVELPQEYYRIGITSGKRPLDSDFKSALVNISDYLVNGNTELASYYADLLVKQYGTNFAATIGVGGLVVMEDVVGKTLVDTHSEEGRKKLSKIAKNVFAKTFHLNATFDKKEIELMEEYKKERKSTQSLVLGGHQNATNFNFEEWKDVLNSTEQAVIQNVDTYSLEDLITADQFEELPPPLVKRVKNAIHNAIDRYYKYNVHAGCTDQTAENFNFVANYDDHSCNASAPEHYTFGGLYQTCTTSGDKKLCKGYEAKNPVTGDYTCPKDFLEVLLRNKHVESTDAKDCLMKCTMEPDICELVCKVKEEIEQIEYRAYWCVNPDPKSKAAGVAFGGLFTSKYVNPNTQLKKCPASYDQVKIDRDINVCVGKLNSNNTDTEIPFGGFYSCMSGNPLSASNDDKNYEYYWPKSCPSGFHPKIADVDQKCTIGYCSVLPHKKGQAFPELIVLASGEPPKENGPFTTAVVILDEVNHDVYYRKTPTGPWLRAHNAEELKEAGLSGLVFDLDPPPTTTESTANNGTSSTDAVKTQDKGNSSPSSWTIAVVVITLVAVVAALVVGGYVYMKKRRDAKQGDSTPIVSTDDGSANQMEEPKMKSGSYDEPPASTSGEAHP